MTPISINRILHLYASSKSGVYFFFFFMTKNFYFYFFKEGKNFPAFSSACYA